MQLRIGIKSSDARRSKEWKFWSHKAEVYASHRKSSGTNKISLHQSRICRLAMIADRPLPAGIDNRLITRWVRAEANQTDAGAGVLAMAIIFPASHLAGSTGPLDSKTRWIDLPTGYGAIAIEVLFAQDAPEKLAETIVATGRHIQAIHSLTNGETVAVTSTPIQWHQEDVVLLRKLPDTHEALMTSQLIPGLERTLQFTTYPLNDVLYCIELTGYRVPIGQGLRLCPGATTIQINTIREGEGPLFR